VLFDFDVSSPTMNNFGVIELAGAKTTSAPGWAYVPDTRPGPASAALQPSNRKRARNAASVATAHNIGDLSARQEARVRKEIEALDREGGGRDSQIAVPLKNGKRKWCFLWSQPFGAFR
jgi:zinc finger HIT domain-containing protein 1